MNNRVSIIIPAYNSAKYLREAVDSALAQTYSDVEIIVVNDGSTDNSAELLRDYGNRIVYIEQPNAGLSAARNTGILASTGDFLVFLDADDCLLPDMAVSLASVLAENELCSLVYCGWYQTDEDGTRFSESDLNLPSGSLFRELFQHGLFVVGSVMIRKSILSRSGVFDPALPQIEDRDMWTRIAYYSDIIFVPERLSEYRSTLGSMSRNWTERKRANKLYLQKMRFFLQSKGESLSLLHDLKNNLYRHYADQCIQDSFTYFWNGEHTLSRKFALRGVLAAPRYLLNRGVLSLLARTIIPGLKKSVN